MGNIHNFVCDKYGVAIMWPYFVVGVMLGVLACLAVWMVGRDWGARDERRKWQDEKGDFTVDR